MTVFKLDAAGNSMLLERHTHVKVNRFVKLHKPLNIFFCEYDLVGTAAAAMCRIFGCHIFRWRGVGVLLSMRTKAIKAQVLSSLMKTLSRSQLM